MSQESQAVLDANVYGDCEANGLPWHARGSAKITADTSTSYWPSAIPLSVVRAKLAEFDVDEYPMAYQVPATDSKGRKITKTITDDTRKVIVRRSNGRVHGVFGADSYTIHQAGEVFTDTLGNIVSESPADLHYSGVGGLRNGGRVYVVIGTGELIRTPQGVDFYSFITGATSHDGTLALTFHGGNVLTVCDNTLAMSLGEGKVNGSQSKVKHTRFSANKLEKVGLTLGLEAQSESMNAAIESLCATTVTDAQWSQFVQALAPITDESTKHATTRNENMRETLTMLYKSDSRVSPWQGTAFGALQAVNTFDLWERGTRGDTNKRERITDEHVSGKLAVRENERAEVLARVLAGVSN